MKKISQAYHAIQTGTILQAIVGAAMKALQNTSLTWGIK